MRTVPPLLVASLMLGAAPIPDAHGAESYDNCTGFIDAVPATIGTQGVWCLRRNLSTAATSGAAITIAANNVTIDCNEFKLGGLAAGNGSQAIGIRALDRQNSTVRRCGIRGFSVGVDVSGGFGHLVEDNRLDNNLRIGLAIDARGSLVRANRVSETGGASFPSDSIGILASADVIDNTVAGVFAEGTDRSAYGISQGSMDYGTGTEIRGNRIRGLTVDLDGSDAAVGIVVAASGVAVVGNHVASQNGGGVGIDGSLGAPLCADNTVAAFQTAFSGCQDGGGNDAY